MRSREPWQIGSLNDLRHEPQMLREEMWHVLRQRLVVTPADAIYDPAANLEAGLDDMTSVSVSAFSGGI